MVSEDVMRPKGWKNLYEGIPSRQLTIEQGTLAEVFERGADAYEEALKKKGIAVDVDKSGSIAHFHYRDSDKGMVGYDMAEGLPAKSKGTLVFIEE